MANESNPFASPISTDTNTVAVRSFDPSEQACLKTASRGLGVVGLAAYAVVLLGAATAAVMQFLGPGTIERAILCYACISGSIISYCVLAWGLFYCSNAFPNSSVRLLPLAAIACTCALCLLVIGSMAAAWLGVNPDLLRSVSTYRNQLIVALVTSLWLYLVAIVKHTNLPSFKRRLAATFIVLSASYIAGAVGFAVVQQFGVNAIAKWLLLGSLAGAHFGLVYLAHLTRRVGKETCDLLANLVVSDRDVDSE